MKFEGHGLSMEVHGKALSIATCVHSLTVSKPSQNKDPGLFVNILLAILEY